jgi:hypothetical protein
MAVSVRRLRSMRKRVIPSTDAGDMTARQFATARKALQTKNVANKNPGAKAGVRCSVQAAIAQIS